MKEGVCGRDEGGCVKKGCMEEGVYRKDEGGCVWKG